MYTLRETIQGIKTIALEPQTNLLATKSFENDVAIDFQNIVNISSPVDFTFFKKRLYISDWDGKYWIIEANRIIEQGEGRAYSKLGELFLSITFLENGKVYEKVMNTEDEIVFEYPISIVSNRVVLEQDYFYCLEKKQILRCIAFRDGKWSSLWTFNTSINYDDLFSIPQNEDEKTEHKIELIVGVYQKQLLIFLDYGELVSLDIETGSILWVKDTIDINNTNQVISHPTIGPFAPIFDKDKGEIYLLKESTLEYFDLNKQFASYEWVVDNYQDGLSPKAIRIQRTCIHGNRIYFIASHENPFILDLIGIFDINKKEIIWQYKLELGNFNNLVQIESNGDTIYVRDHQNNLYIFEKR